MKYYLVYQFEYLRCRIFFVPKGSHLDDIAGKYFTMDHGKEDGDGSIKGAYDTLDEARAEAMRLFQEDKKKVLEFEKIIQEVTCEKENRRSDF